MTTVIGTWDSWIGAIHDVLGGVFEPVHGLTHGVCIIGNGALLTAAHMIDPEVDGLAG